MDTSAVLKKSGIALAVTAISCAIVLAVLRHKETHLPAECKLPIDSCHVNLSFADIERKLRYHPPARQSVTNMQSNDVAAAFTSIADAFAEGRLSDMKAAMAAFPLVVTNMPDQLFHSLSRPVRDILLNDFLDPSTTREFNTAEEFASYARNNIELLLFWGEILLKRGDFDGPVIFLDHAVLHKLLIYRDEFHSRKLDDCVLCVDGIIDEWHGHIESENGFTRRQMWFRVDLNWPLYNEGTLTSAQISEIVKGFASGLIRLGYTPKWLKEFDDLSDALK